MAYKHKLILFCKSYVGDISRAEVLYHSIQQHNKDDIPFYVLIPQKDLAEFSLKLPKAFFLLEEELNITKEQSHFSQQLYKMSLYKLGLAEYYFTMDSDMYFIRPFYKEDFLTQDNIPYFTIHECKDLLEYSECIIGSGQLREWFINERIKVMDVFGRRGKVYDYSGSAILYISSIFEGLDENYCKPNNLSFLDLLEFNASENTWFGEYALHSNLRYLPCNPMFKTFHYKWQYDLAKQLGITEQILANNYLGITMQSNWGAPLKF